MDPFLQTILALSMIIGGCGYAYGQYKDRRNGSKFDTVKLFKDQIDALEGKVNLQDSEIRKLTTEIHDLKTTIELKDRKLSDALTILQGRDPKMQLFMQELLDYINIGKPAIRAITEEIIPVVKRMEKYLDKQSF